MLMASCDDMTNGKAVDGKMEQGSWVADDDMQYIVYSVWLIIRRQRL